jgi:hypothetical protein
VVSINLTYESHGSAFLAVFLSFKFNTLERDFKYLLILLRDDLPWHEARKQALEIKNAGKLLKEVCCHFRAKFPDPDLQKEFGEIYDEANAGKETAKLDAA